jgi:hypothetical protein
MNGALLGLIDKNPSAAAKLALSKRTEEVYASVWQQIGRTWAAQNAAEAAEWVRQLPAGRSQQQTVNSVIHTWASSDAGAAGTWIDGLQPGDLRDQATSTFARHVSREDPVGAMTWAGSIQNEQTKLSLISSLLQDWANRDLSAARNWTAAHPDLPEYVRRNVPQLAPKP